MEKSPDEAKRGSVVITSFLKYFFCFVLLVLTGSAQGRLIAFYPFEGSFEDVLGDPQKTFIPANNPVFVPGLYGQAVSFNGIDQTAVTTSFVVQDFSIVFWIQTTDFQPGGNRKFWNGKGILSADYEGCTDEIGDWAVCLENTDKAGFGIGGFCDDVYDVLSLTPINDGQWHFVCCTRNGSTGEYKIYVDEGPAEETYSLTPVYPRKPLPLYLASTSGEPGKFLNAWIDQLAVFDHVLTQTEIDGIRLHGIHPPLKAVRISPLPDPPVPSQVLLRWTHPNRVESYRLYLDTDPARVAEPNLPAVPMLIGGLEIAPASSSDPNGSLLFDGVEPNQTYYWRVDTLVIEPNWLCVIPDTNEPCWNHYTWVKGDVWSFASYSESLTFFGTLEDRYVLPDLMTLRMPSAPQVEWSIEAVSARPILTFQWLCNGQPLPINETKYTEERSIETPFHILSRLTIHNAGEQDEGVYRVRVVLDNLEEYESVPASLYVSSERIVHRWSLNENLEDSVGDADASAMDPLGGRISLEDGAAVFASEERLSGDPNAHFIDLPNGLLSALGNNLTLMVWFTAESAAANQPVFSFGISEEGEGQSGTPAGSRHLMLTPQNDHPTYPKMMFESRLGGSVQVLTAPPAPPGQEICAAVVWSSPEQTMRLYVNGQLKETANLNGRLSDLDDRNNWLGRSQIASHPLFQGRINELRIYNVPLSEPWIQALYENGPDSDPLEADPCLEVNPFDANRDCVVDIADFAVFAENWLWCGRLSCLE